MPQTEFLRLESRLPEFSPLDDRLRTMLETVMQSTVESSVKREVIAKLAEREPKFKQLQYELTRGSGQTFRPQAEDWHLDGITKTDKLEIFASSSTTRFAACDITFYDSCRTLVGGMKPTLPNIMRTLHELIGKDWLERAAADPEEEAYRIPHNFVKVDDLVIVQPLPYVVAYGERANALHQGSVWTDIEPSDRVISVRHIEYL